MFLNNFLTDCKQEFYIIYKQTKHRKCYTIKKKSCNLYRKAILKKKIIFCKTYRFCICYKQSYVFYKKEKNVSFKLNIFFCKFERFLFLQCKLQAVLEQLGQTVARLISLIFLRNSRFLESLRFDDSIRQ